jgi:glutathione S-transferase
MELIGFKLCPFVQRVLIALLEKNADFSVTYIDLANLPPWFAEISPHGKVPLLKTQGTVLFESAVICDYLDDILMPVLHPPAPLQKAQHRAWIAFISECLMLQHQFYTAADNAACDAAKNSLREKLRFLEKAVSPAPYFHGSAFSQVDAACAPLFMRFDVLGVSADFYTDTPKLRAWHEAVLARPSVQNSVSADFAVLFDAYLQKQGGVFKSSSE